MSTQQVTDGNNLRRVADHLEATFDYLAGLTDVSFPNVTGDLRNFPRPSPDDEVVARGFEILREDTARAVAVLRAVARAQEYQLPYLLHCSRSSSSAMSCPSNRHRHRLRGRVAPLLPTRIKLRRSGKQLASAGDRADSARPIKRLPQPVHEASRGLADSSRLMVPARPPHRRQAWPATEGAHHHHRARARSRLPPVGASGWINRRAGMTASGSRAPRDGR
jgi:hypothetical protein